MKKILGIYIGILFISFMHTQAQLIIKNENPGTLWTDNLTDSLKDHIARREGDLLTVAVSETLSGSFSATTTLSKADTNMVEQISNYAILNRFFRPFTTQDSGSTKGSGTTNAAGNLNTQFTVVVKEVLPNRRLRIEGTRSIVINRETQTYILSGIVREDDIQPNNVILSTSIADATIEAVGKGAIHDRQRRGILTRIVDWLF